MEHWMLPMLAIQAPDLELELAEDDWVSEGKLDGWRLMVHKAEDGGIRVFGGRNGHEYSGQAPYLEEELGELLPADTCVDGELISPKGHGGVQSSMTTTGPHQPSAALPALQLVLFDLIRLSGNDIRSAAWHQRRHLLELLMDGEHAHVRSSLILPNDVALEVALNAGLEGIVAKRRNSVYFNARSSNWIKFKPQQTCEAKIVGFKPGKVGGFWDGKVGAFEIELLDNGALTTIKCGTNERHEDATAHPENWEGRIVEIRHHGLSKDGIPRHPQFFRLRPDRSGLADERRKDADGRLPAGPATPKRRRPPVPSDKPWMRNYRQMGDEKLERSIAELEAGCGDAYDRVLAHNADVAIHLAAARAAQQERVAA